MLNIQNDTVYMDTEERYSELPVNILVKDQNLPDIMVVTDREILKELVENDLWRILQRHLKCISSRIKEMYESYGDALLNSGKFNGRLMAVPGNSDRPRTESSVAEKGLDGGVGAEEPENF